MAGSGEPVKALVRSHASGDDDAFYSVALQVAAQAARQGHRRLADGLRKTIEASRTDRSARVVSIAQPRGGLASNPDSQTDPYPPIQTLQATPVAVPVQGAGGQALLTP
ncbi:MAG: hypothetical protein Q4D89_10890 [Arachnia propionica]|uniref:hypothetical protein n=1 Tax=Arachnia propionica TaxID=1750 RepID=UPI002706BDB9|nr:hypothetical protein [Arachnia propionica]